MMEVKAFISSAVENTFVRKENKMHDPNCCPDCGELLSVRRGVIPLTATLYCPACNWCDVADGDRQEDVKQDWYVRNVRNREDNRLESEELH